MVNSRVRMRPAFGRGSSRSFVWNWYHVWGSSRYEFSSVASVDTTSSCVMPRARAAPLRSLSRNISSPMTSQRPLRCQSSAGCMTGIRISWAPILFISSRMMPMTFSRTRTASGSSE